MEIFERIAAVAAAKPKQRDIYDLYANNEFIIFSFYSSFK